MSNNEYEQQQFWNKAELIRLGIGTYKVSLGKQLMNDLLVWGQCACKISDKGIERIEPNTYIINGK
jgi:hypothetical protein